MARKPLPSGTLVRVPYFCQGNHVYGVVRDYEDGYYKVGVIHANRLTQHMLLNGRQATWTLFKRSELVVIAQEELDAALSTVPTIVVGLSSNARSTIQSIVSSLKSRNRDAACMHLPILTREVPAHIKLEDVAKPIPGYFPITGPFVDEKSRYQLRNGR